MGSGVKTMEKPLRYCCFHHFCILPKCTLSFGNLRYNPHNGKTVTASTSAAVEEESA